MPAYIVAMVRIHDAEKFTQYSRSIAGLSERFGGESLARGKVSEILEGSGEPGERVVVSRYPDLASARAYLASPEYREACQHRVGAADVVVRLVES